MAQVELVTEGMRAISATELSRKDWISSGHGASPEAGQGDLKGVRSQASTMATPSAGVVDMPETARTLQELIERVLTASATEEQVAAYTRGYLLAKMETPMPVPQARRPRVSVGWGD